MPKYIHKGFGPIGKSIALIIVVLFFVAVIWKAPAILLIIPVIGIWSYLDTNKWKKKLSNMAIERKDCDIGTFAKSFDYRKIDTWIIRAVYEEVQNYISRENIKVPILASDRLIKDLGIDPEDLNEYLMEVIAQRTGRTFDDYEKNPYFNNLNTVSDLVGYFNYQPLENKDAQQMAQQQTC